MRVNVADLRIFPGRSGVPTEIAYPANLDDLQFLEFRRSVCSSYPPPKTCEGRAHGCHVPAERPVSPAAPPAPASASAQASSPAAASSASPTVLLRFAQVTRDRWRADYTFSAPVRAVAFSSGPYAARRAWRVVTDGGRIVRAESGDYIVASGPVRALSIEIPESTAQPEKDYRDFYRFSDGGALPTATLAEGGRRLVPGCPVFGVHHTSLAAAGTLAWGTGGIEKDMFGDESRKTHSDNSRRLRHSGLSG